MLFVYVIIYKCVIVCCLYMLLNINMYVVCICYCI